MCNFFSAIMTEKRIYAYPGMDSHSEILGKAGVKDTNLNPEFVKGV